MILKVFRGTGPGVIFLIILALVVLWIGAFIDPQAPGAAVYETRPMPLYGILKFMTGSHPFPGVIFSFLILSLLLYLLVNFNTSVFFINERTFFPAFVYLFIISLFPGNRVLSPAVPAALFLILAMIRIMDAYRKPGIAFNFFDTGMLIGIGSLFYANLIWFGVLVIIGIALLRTGSVKEIALSMLGLITPFVITIGLLYVFGKEIPTFLEDFKENLFNKIPEYSYSRLTTAILIYAGLLTFASIGFLLSRMNTKKIKSRKTFYLLLWSFFISLAMYIILPSVSVEIIWLIGIPASYFLVHYFLFVRKKLVPEIILTGFFLLVLLIQVLDIF
jgi:hypothetical protein